jgi:hypothetical protein
LEKRDIQGKDLLLLFAPGFACGLPLQDHISEISQLDEPCGNIRQHKVAVKHRVHAASSAACAARRSANC